MRKQENSSQTINIIEDTKIPGTDIILEAGDKIQVLTEIQDYDFWPGRMPRKITVTVAETGKKMTRNATVYGDNLAIKLKNKWVYVYNVNGEPTVFLEDTEGPGLHISKPQQPR
jgi:hypothetical protein